MKTITKRILDINLPVNRSAFLWGPRKTGKTYWINKHYKDVMEKWGIVDEEGEPII
ncbi:hypothetical protein LCGC14_2325620 [marine sediment metagenome]|uniref:Uncharacterized protein n=1 Tax=marine sediment metagenome TaxID=412755 RepID=A0A0F9D416_9ZZZZ